MSLTRMPNLLPLVALAAWCSACTYGVVYDESDSALLGRAKVKFQKVSLSSRLITDRVIDGQLVGLGRNDVFSSLGTTGVSAVTWSSTDTGANDAQGIYYLNPYGNATFGTSLAVQVNGGWNRIVVGRTGYDTRVFYRNHQYAECQVPKDQGPISASHFAFIHPQSGPFWDAASAGGTPQCAPQHFGLRRSDRAYPLDPDLIVDLRSMRDFETSFNCSDLSTSAVRCLRVSVSTANVGAGALEVRRSSSTAPIEQVLYDSTGNVRATLFTRLPTSTTLDFVKDGHNHMHLSGWTSMRLRKIGTNCATELTAANCRVAAQHEKVGFCLADINHFDSGLNRFSTNSTYTLQSCETVTSTRMGISVGWYDLYGKTLNGQAIPIDGLTAGNYWLEVEVNPVNSSGQRPIIESDYTNNITRLKVAISSL